MSISELFQILLNRSPSELELKLHTDKCTTRQEFLECEEFQSQLKPCKIVALLMAGQVRNVDICASALLEFVIGSNPDTEFHLFVATQDSVCIKPRLGHGKTNQYIVIQKNPLEELNKHFNQNLIKKIQVRNTYNTLIQNQNEDLTFKEHIGWAEAFLDLSIAIKICQEYSRQNAIEYDCFIRVRPDLLFTCPIKLYVLPSNVMRHSQNGFSVSEMFFQDAFFICDKICCDKLKDFYDYYIEITKNNITTWDHEKNMERVLPQYLVNNKIDIIHDKIANCALPIGWLIADLKKNNNYLHLFPLIWQNKLLEFNNHLCACVFDI